MSATSAILPCPFCGFEGHVWSNGWAGCAACGADKPSLKEWNSRAEADVDAVIAELEAELLKFKQAFGEALLEIAELKAREKP